MNCGNCEGHCKCIEDTDDQWSIWKIFSRKRDELHNCDDPDEWQKIFDEMKELNGSTGNSFDD